MAIIDPIEDNSEEISQVQDTQPEPNQEPVQQQAAVEEDLPAKYRGKTAKEIAQMHMEAEKLIGKHAQEVGEVRRLADELIKRQLEPKKEVAPPVQEEIDFFEDPDKAVAKKIDSHPAIQEAKEQARQLKQMQTINRLQQSFPDFQSTVADPEFAEWVKSSPVRLRLYAAADAEFDYDSAAELLTTWKYVKPAKQQTEQVAEIAPEVKQAQKTAVRSATVDVGSTTGAPVSSKIYRRADLIRLNLEDPDRYEALQPEIMQAYREGRVR